MSHSIRRASKPRVREWSEKDMVEKEPLYPHSVKVLMSEIKRLNALIAQLQTTPAGTVTGLPTTPPCDWPELPNGEAVRGEINGL
jgi:predicted phosphohydrolase